MFESDEIYDIFISYKNDGEGRNFAARLNKKLKELGYDVFYNNDEEFSGSFPDKLRKVIVSCKDLLLIVTQPCIDQLIRNEKIDWVREELLTAYSSGVNIIPLLMPGVCMPKDKDVMPPELAFLPDTNSINITEPYDRSPLMMVLGKMKTKQSVKGEHRNTYNSNSIKNIDDDIGTAMLNTHDPRAMFELANMYYYGIAGGPDGCERNYIEAYNILDALTKTDTIYAQYAHSLLAEMYYHGIMPRHPQSYEQAFEHHEKAKLVSGFSAREAAYLKSRGCGCEYDYDSIVEYYIDAIENGDYVAAIGLGKFYLSYGKYKEAAQLFRKISSAWPEAEYQLGLLYRNGVLEDPPKPDYFKAAFYFQHAIDSGRRSGEVYHELGRLFFTPVGDFPKDFKEAEKNFLIAAELGNKDAQYKLGLMYEYGYVTRDVEKAIHYHTLAAEQGISFSAYHLAMLYQEPLVKNYQEAFKYAEIAANKRVMEGEFIFGVFLYYGRGCVADENRAYKYLKRAADHGMGVAALFLDKISAGSNETEPV